MRQPFRGVFSGWLKMVPSRDRKPSHGHPGRLRDVPRPCAVRIAALAGFWPRVTPASLPSPVFNIAPIAFQPIFFFNSMGGAYAAAAMWPIALLRSLWTFQNFRRIGSPSGCGKRIPNPPNFLTHHPGAAHRREAGLPPPHRRGHQLSVLRGPRLAHGAVQAV
jgi:hypothetical protein